MSIHLDYYKLYQFRYVAKLEGQINVYDKNPIIMILDHRGDNILGLNFNWIPHRLRREFFEEVIEIMDKTHKVGKKLERMRLTYKLLQRGKFRPGLNAIRMYYVDNMSVIKDIPEKQWPIVFKVSKSFRPRFVKKENNYKD